MEDRTTPVLYLELGDADQQSAASRSGELAALPAVDRVTWWDNCVFERTDLPRRIRDGRTLHVAEATEGFTPPEPPAGVSEAHQFRRHPRPSQGILSDGPTLGLLLVWISPREPEVAQALRDWGDFVHIRHIAAAGIPGFSQISVYENTEPADPRFMHFYEFDNRDAETTFSTMVSHVAPRLGGGDTAAYEQWADWRAAGGRLFYCTTFRFVGETSASR